LNKILHTHTSAGYKESVPAVCSIPNGAGSAARDIGRLLPEIRKYFKDVTLCFDDDEAGQAAVNAVCKIAPDFKVIHLPMKDANECLIKGAGKAVYKACTFNTQEVKNTKLVWGYEVEEAAMEPTPWGLSWPWPKMTEATRGIRFGETIYIAAAEKMGKSEVLNAIAVHMMVAHKLKVFMAKPEEANKKTHKLLCGKVEGRVFHDAKVEFDREAYLRASAQIKHMYCMLDLYQNIKWATLKNDLYDAAGKGVKVTFIDPITNLTNGMGSSEKNDFLAGFAQEVSTVAKDLDLAVFLFCHLNKPPKGVTPFDRGGKVTTDFFAGSSAMARSCNYAIAIEGDKDPDKPVQQRNLRDLVLLADREHGEVERIPLYWDINTHLFNEVR
jgi:twinkle protein